MTEPTATPLTDSARVFAGGYRKWALDLSGRSYLAPDGERTVTAEQALAELDAREPKV
jgi:hypothetical protein